MEELDYDFKLGINNQPTAKIIKMQTDGVVKAIREKAGDRAEVLVRVRDEGPQLFSVSLNVIGSTEIYHVQKKGKKLVPTLKKVKRSILRKIKKEQPGKARRKIKKLRALRAS